ncbi:uncharacterized protein LOC115621408 isoform X2 [Scaptodrosophila lebanonensis]|uniref:Uncharacterized protein LOC115621408 isoform X2 n=1 Tax=Drosophila lebanonensis TaxID=7225 RepID=A0A6J2T717_DROLE|nr:uncharacterized protein LOC115621408 isoform X2 [Scaptodrosophila lebanonensis]
MRRSKAPSIRKMAKNTSFDSNANVNSFRSPSPPMQWGTSNGYQHWGPKNYEDNENPLKDKRIFRILWRNISNRKHKIWNGDGTLEVTAADATLKDHTGKIMGALKTFNFNPRDFKEHELLQIAGKEVELQEEFKTIEECVAQRKQEIALAFHVESDDEENNHNRPQKVNMLKAPKRAPVARALTEYICMLRPAELQLWALKVCEQYAQAMPAGHQFSDDIVNISRWICDHPAIVKNHANPTSQLMLRLLEHLPPAKEMQIYDSAKFECICSLLDNLVVEHGERCAIIATNAEILDIIKDPHQMLKPLWLLF